MTTLLTLAMSFIIIQDYLSINDIASYIDTDSLSIISSSAIVFKPAAYPRDIQPLQKGNTLEQALTPLPVNEPWMLPSEIYGALIGLLCSTGCTFIPNKHAYMYPDEFRMVFSATNLDFVLWLQAYFAPWIFYTAEGNVPKPYTNASGTSTVWRVATSSSLILVNILHEHWRQVGINFLPDHFEVFFGWTTLAFWAMRNGLW